MLQFHTTEVLLSVHHSFDRGTLRGLLHLPKNASILTPYASLKSREPLPIHTLRQIRFSSLLDSMCCFDSFNRLSVWRLIHDFVESHTKGMAKTYGFERKPGKKEKVLSPESCENQPEKSPSTRPRTDLGITHWDHPFHQHQAKRTRTIHEKTHLVGGRNPPTAKHNKKIREHRIWCSPLLA